MPLSWFRRPKAKEGQAPSAAAVPTAEPELQTAVESPAETVPGADVQLSPAKKRRRGSRGGRGRKKKPAAAGAAGAATDAAAEPAAAEAAPTRSRRGGAAKPAADGEKKPAERKAREPRTRSPRRTAPRRAPLPKAKRELLVSVDAGEKRVAVFEDGVVAEVYLERPEQRSIAGNIYLGTVDNVLPGMEAAFVEIGLEKNGFLYVDEIVGPELEGRKGARKIQDLIQRGQTVLVQAVKDPMKTKGARLTTEISLPGRFVVYVPHGDGLGVSRRLEDEERNRLKAIVKEIAPELGGVIVRTAAEGASAEDVARDLDFLCRLWGTIEASAKKATAPSLIYQEAELPLRVTRDLFTGDFERLLVDHDRTYKRIVGYLKKTSPHMVDRVTRYKEREPLLEAFGVEQEIRSTLNRRVDLPSGGYLIFDYAEAFTVIDVNTGRFVGSRSKRNGPGRLEDTITKNNLEAVKEVVRQLRLRDVGGIIVIDFIDMANPKNRQQVEDDLRQELERDRTKTYVVEISPLGLVEMTRQNVTDGPREVMTRKCPTCDGDGIVVSEGTTAVEVERKLRALVTPGSRAKAFKVELNSRIAALLVGPDGSRLQELEEITKRRFFFVGIDDVHLDHCRCSSRGRSRSWRRPAPVEVGQELELKLGEVGLHDPRAGAGKLKGFEIVVAEAAKLVGKKVQVRIVAVMEGAAYGVLVEGASKSDLPITAEAEAERPTRARRQVRAASADLSDDAELEGEEDEEPEEAPGEDEPAAERPTARRTAAPKPAATAKPAARTRARKPAGEPAAAVEGDGEGEAAEQPAPKPRRSRRTAAPTEPVVAEAAAGEAEVEVDARGGRRGRAGGGAEEAHQARDTRWPQPQAQAGGGGRHERGLRGGARCRGRGRSRARARERAGFGTGAGDSRSRARSGAKRQRAGRRRRRGAGPRSGTRRGSRGGRNRRRKPAAGTAGVETETAEGPEPAAVAETAPAPASEGQNGSDGWEYTPMSEWDRD